MSKYEDLERLQKLKENGVLTEQEFEEEKKKILNEADNTKVETKKEEKKNENTDSKKTKVIEESTEKKQKNKKIFTTTYVIVAVVIIIAIVIIPMIQSEKEKSNKSQVPNIVGKTLSEARDELSKLELNIEAQYPSLYSDSPDAIIQSQDNNEGDTLEKGSTVKVIAKSQEQLDQEQQEKEKAEEEKKQKEQEAKDKGYRSSPATKDVIESCAKSLISNSLRSSSTARWDKCEKIDEDNYGRCLVYVSLEAQNGFGAYTKSSYFVVLQYVEADGKYTYKPYSYSYELTSFSGQSTYDSYVREYKNGNVYAAVQTFLSTNEWNKRPSDV